MAKTEIHTTFSNLEILQDNLKFSKLLFNQISYIPSEHFKVLIYQN